MITLVSVISNKKIYVGVEPTYISCVNGLFFGFFGVFRVWNMEYGIWDSNLSNLKEMPMKTQHVSQG